MTKIEALRKSVENWEGGKNQGDECALCEKYLDEDGCNGCPLFEKWGMSCNKEGSLYLLWKGTPFGYSQRLKYGLQIWNDLKELLREAEEEANDD